MSNYTLKDVARYAILTNSLFRALYDHPSFNKTSPQQSPKPLWFAADFVRRTYIEYVCLLLPPESLYNNSQLANPVLFGYGSEHGKPDVPQREGREEEEDNWLAAPSNWPRDVVRKRPKYKELFEDVVSRSAMIGFIITDPVNGAMIVGGVFDWSGNPEIERIANELKESG